MDGRLFAFDAGAASDEQLRELYDFLMHAAAHDGPEPETEKSDHERYEAFVSSLFRRNSPEPNGRMTFLLARSRDRVAVSIGYTFAGEPDQDLALVTITVHPEQRRQGTGTAVLRAVIPAIRAAGRTRIGATVRSGTAEQWAWNIGFRPVARLAFQHLTISEADPALWQNTSVPAGYRLESWDNTTPEHLLESYARARQGFENLIHHRHATTRTDWTPQRIREDEADSAARNAICRVVAAIHEATEEVVGMTETAVFPTDPPTVAQGYTAVVHEHQGNGLGRAMKAAMIRRLLSEHPTTAKITTRALGDHMLRLNRSLGYQTAAEYAFVEAPIEQLEGTWLSDGSRRRDLKKCHMKLIE